MAFKIESSLLDACALAILHRGDTYGYEITQEMKKSITVSESTLYPVLRRLQKEGLCMTYDQPYQGRNRRYYRITEKGEAQLSDYLKQWNDYRTAVQRLLYGPEKEAEPVKKTEKSPEKEPGKNAGPAKEEQKKAEKKTEAEPVKKAAKKKAKKNDDKAEGKTEGGAGNE